MPSDELSHTTDDLTQLQPEYAFAHFYWSCLQTLHASFISRYYLARNEIVFGKTKIVKATGYHSLVPNVVGAIRADLVQCIKTDWQRSKAATSSIGKIRFSSHWIRKEFKPRLVKIKTFATSESEHTQHGDDYARSTIDAITQYLAIN